MNDHHEQLIPDARSRIRPAHAVEKKIRAKLGMLPVSQMRMETAVRRGSRTSYETVRPARGAPRSVFNADAATPAATGRTVAFEPNTK